MTRPLRVAAFTGGHDIPSTRFRVRQYLTELERLEITVREFGAPFGAWPPETQWLRPLWATATLASRLPAVVASYGYELTLLQREILSTFRTIERFVKEPRVLDLDDAVWLNREASLRRLVTDCTGVVCGNSFIAGWVSRWNENVCVIPTAVDTTRWRPLELVESSRIASQPIIGWSGSRSGVRYLLAIEGALACALERHPGAVLRVVSDRRPDFRQLPADRVEFVQWSPQNEVRTMQEMTVGLMPLDDTEWERGKCSYKMLLYMACGLPVIVSPVGMNNDVLRLGNVGLSARQHDEWIDALDGVLADPDRGARMGAAGRDVVLAHFDLPLIAARLATYFRSVVE